jgi:hypothetical protein
MASNVLFFDSFVLFVPFVVKRLAATCQSTVVPWNDLGEQTVAHGAAGRAA